MKSKYQTKKICRDFVVLSVLIVLFCVPSFYLDCTEIFPFSLPSIFGEIWLLDPLRDGVSRCLECDGVTP